MFFLLRSSDYSNHEMAMLPNKALHPTAAGERDERPRVSAGR